jgi:hypothetical protein
MSLFSSHEPFCSIYISTVFFTHTYLLYNSLVQAIEYYLLTLTQICARYTLMKSLCLMRNIFRMTVICLIRNIFCMSYLSDEEYILYDSYLSDEEYIL